MTRYLFVLMAFISLNIYAQDEPGTQAGTIDVCNTCNLTPGNISTATQSAIPFCDGVGSNDVFYTITAPAPLEAGDQIGIKVTVENAAFDAAIEILDAGNASVACSNENAGPGYENMVHYGFTQGATYHIRIYAVDGVVGTGNFDICIQQLPELFVRNNFVGFGLSGDGYTVNELISRQTFVNPAPVEMTGWLFVCVDDLSEIYVEISGTNPNINLNQVPGVCYDKTYMVYVRVMIAGSWCGYGQGREIIMEPAPRTAIQPAYCGQSYPVNSGILVATFLGATAITEWEFSTDNANTVFSIQSNPGSSAIFLDDVPQMRYNKVYQVRVRANVCGLWGPWSLPCPIITQPLPYTEMLSNFCNTIVPSNATWVCYPIALADTYVWQVAPIDCGDTEFVPTGPAQVFFVYGGTNVFNLGQAEIIPGQCYRVGVKAYVGEQQGEYGYFCEVQAAGGVAPPPPSSIAADESPLINEWTWDGEMGVYPNPSNTGNFTLNMSAVPQDLSFSVQVYNSTGQLVMSEQLNSTGADQIQMTAGNDLGSGMYFIKVLDQNQSVIGSEMLIVE